MIFFYKLWCYMSLTHTIFVIEQHCDSDQFPVHEKERIARGDQQSNNSVGIVNIAGYC